jgi:hypothetical protein
MSDNTGGRAFPVPNSNGRTQECGMTLRDYFAAKALAGCWAHCGPDIDPDYEDWTARRCYQMADAMLRARETK